MKVKYLKFVPLQNLVEEGLTMNEVVFVSILVSFTKDDKTLRAGQDNLAEAMGITGKTISRIASSLKRKGLISVISGKAQRNANTYYPSIRLMSLYGQNVPIDRDKKSNHTPKGYSKEVAFLNSLPHKERTSAELQLRHYNYSLEDLIAHYKK
tara:strand:+ start:4598 stop:5056 length:459 start_codon:yes stop_codon:yes gene_type:complete